MTNDQETSVSGCLSAPFEHVSTTFTDIETLSISETNVVAKAKRYGRWWLLKALRKERAEEAGYQQRLQKEFEILMQLQHPNVVMTVGIENVESLGRCIVMEYVEGVTLKEWFKEDLSRQAKVEIARQMVEAVVYIHSKGIVHRDLKPENIIITLNGSNVKLIDFGLADTNSHAILKQPAGTPRYMSPEQRQTTVADVRNDIYSIGIILEQMELGVSYRYIIKRCKQPIEYRFQNATELLNSMNATASHLKKIVVASWALLTVVLLLLVGIQLRQAAEQEDRLAMLNTTMEQQREAQQEQMEIQQQQLSEVTDTLARLKAYNQEQIEQESMLQTKRVKMKSATEKGYAIVDRAMRQTGIDHHLDTLSDIRYLWPDFTKKSQAGLQAIEAYKREISSSFDTHETEQIVSALSQHIAEKVEKWNQKITDIAK